jgi:hypothetical protein
MLCPACNKNETSIVSDKYEKKTNAVKRKRYCVCGHLFATYEKFEKLRKKRIERPDTQWKNTRFVYYATERVLEAHSITLKAFKKVFGLKTKDLIIEKKIKKVLKYSDYINEKGKSYLTIETKKDRKIHKFKIGGKKQTIRNILKNQVYWEHRWMIVGIPGVFDFDKAFEFKFKKNFAKYRDKRIKEIAGNKVAAAGNKDAKLEYKIVDEYFENKGKGPNFYELSTKDFQNVMLDKDGEISNDILDKDIVRKEVDEFYKSVCTYIKDKEYNQDFFVRNDKAFSDFWKKDWWWETYLKVR